MLYTIEQLVELRWYSINDVLDGTTRMPPTSNIDF